MLQLSKQRLSKDLQYLLESSNSTTFKEKSTSFSRLRKLSYEDTILSVLHRKGVSLSIDVANYFNTKGEITMMSRQAYVKQRLNLDPQFFNYLNQFHVRNVYHMEPKLEKMKGLFLLAVDGSDILVPTTEQTIKHYGSTSKKGVRPCATAKLFTMYDALNKFTIYSALNKNKYSETITLRQGLEEIQDMFNDNETVIIMDRNYFSFKLVYHFQEIMKQHFVMRMREKDLKIEKSKMISKDEIITIELTRQRLNMYRNDELYDTLKSIGKMKVRMVCYELDNGEIEYLITDLGEEFTYEDIGKIYHYRWKIESSYDVLKNKLKLENFTGKLPHLIEQDVYATIYLCNVMEDIIGYAENKHCNKIEEKKYKYEMQINRNISIGILKEKLIVMALEKDPKRREEMFKGVIEQIQQQVVPIRPGRKNVRNKNPKKQNYPMNQKKAY